MSPSASRNRILEMLMSGKSGSSAASTAPIANGRGAAVGLTLGGLLGSTGIEHQSELADLDLVASLQSGLIDPLPVDVGAVQGADVAHQEGTTLAVEGRMLARHRDVVKEDVTLGVTPGADLVRVEQESCTGVRPAKDHQQRRALTQRVDRGLVLGRQGGVSVGVCFGPGLRCYRYSDGGQAHGGGVVRSPLFLPGLVVRHDLCACFRCGSAGQSRSARYAARSRRDSAAPASVSFTSYILSLIHISEPTRLGMISYAVFCLKKKKEKK